MGSQEPSARIAPEYPATDGQDAVRILRAGGTVLDPWQSDILDDWMSRTVSGKWAAPTAGGSVPRQNGKSLLVHFGRVPGLTKEEQQQLSDLAAAYNYHQSRNAAKDKYYEGHITLNDVNLGIALPQGLRNLEVGCSWGQKAVDVLAARSMFDGFVGSGGSLDSLAKLVTDNRLVAEYAKACRDELKYGCVFATLSADASISCRVRFHSPAMASALWSGEKGRIDCGLAIVDTVKDEHFEGT